MESTVVPIYHTNIFKLYLAIEMFIAKNNIEPSLLKEIFVDRQYNGPTHRSNTDFVKPTINSVYFDKESLKYFGNTV